MDKSRITHKRQPTRGLWFVVMGIAIASTAWAQSIETDGDIKTHGRLISMAQPGDPPLYVQSAARVEFLNADLLDGRHSSFFASIGGFFENQAAIAENRAAIAFHNPDPPCFSNTHRFVDCGNGTVTDTTTGLIWMKDAGCVGAMNYTQANALAPTLFEGAFCGLSDNSNRGDWRLPTREEWQTIIDPNCPVDPPNDPKLVGNGVPSIGCFKDAPWATNVDESAHYWTSSSVATLPGFASGVNMSSGQILGVDKTFNDRAWLVRTGR